VTAFPPFPPFPLARAARHAATVVEPATLRAIVASARAPDAIEPPPVAVDDNAEGDGKHRGKVPCNALRPMHLVARNGCECRCARAE